METKIQCTIGRISHRGMLGVGTVEAGHSGFDLARLEAVFPDAILERRSCMLESRVQRHRFRGGLHLLVPGCCECVRSNPADSRRSAVRQIPGGALFCPPEVEQRAESERHRVGAGVAESPRRIARLTRSQRALKYIPFGWNMLREGREAMGLACARVVAEQGHRKLAELKKYCAESIIIHQDE